VPVNDRLIENNFLSPNTHQNLENFSVNQDDAENLIKQIKVTTDLIKNVISNNNSIQFNSIHY